MNPNATPLKYLVRINPETLGEDAAPDLEFRYIEISYVGRGKLQVDPIQMTLAEAPSRARRVLAQGDTIISTVRTYLRAVWTLTSGEHDLIASTGFACLRPSAQIDARFLGWLAQSDVVVDEVVARSVGVSYPAINANEIGTIKIELPTISEQRAMADYLDRTVPTIDALISAKRRLLTLLSELASSLVLQLTVNEYAAGGAPTANDLRPSSRARPAKRLMRKLDRPTRPDDEVVTAFRDGEVNVRSARRSDGYTFSEIEDQYQGVEVGDIVFHGLDGFAGAVGTASARGKCTPVYHVCEALDGNDPRFLALTLRSLGMIGFLAAQSGNVRERAVDFRTWRALGRVPLPTPEIQVQSVAAAEALKAVGDERELRSLLERQLTVLEEYRQTLITAVVDRTLEISAAN